ncbi:hypothetical protein GCM10022383_23510 [Microbacterium soli]|uniref:Uncharacterized protein n=2 Tax=Microbacterium soli TaxID=446075 RepID=A0ABP7NEY3_9MICO
MREVRLDIGPAIPGSVLPVVAAAAATGASAAMGLPQGWVGAAGALALLGGIVRQSGGAWLAAAVPTVSLLLAPPNPWRTAAVIGAVHALHVLGSLMLVVPLRSRIALAALRPAARCFLLVQLVGQAVGAGAWLVAGHSGLPAAVIAGALAVLAFTILMVGRLRGQRQRAFPAPASAPMRGRTGPDVGGPS